MRIKNFLNFSLFCLLFSGFGCQHFKSSNLQKTKESTRGLAALPTDPLHDEDHRRKSSKSFYGQLQSGKMVASKAILYEGKKPVCLLDLTKGQKRKIGQIGWTAGSGFQSQIQFKKRLPFCSNQISHKIDRTSRDFILKPKVAAAPAPLVGAAGAAGVSLVSFCIDWTIDNTRYKNRRIEKTLLTPILDIGFFVPWVLMCTAVTPVLLGGIGVEYAIYYLIEKSGSQPNYNDGLPDSP